MRLMVAGLLTLTLLLGASLPAYAQTSSVDVERVVLSAADVPIGWGASDQFLQAAFQRTWNSPSATPGTDYIASVITPVDSVDSATTMLRTTVRSAKIAPNNWTDTGQGSGIGDESVLLVAPNGTWYQVDFRKGSYFLQMLQDCSDCGTQRDALTRAKKMESNLEALLATAPASASAAPSPAPACQFVLGFKALHDLDPADTGDCVDNQASAANGDAQQHTSTGLMAWRKADNWTAFTNGYQTWINGPTGLVTRLNNQRFPWEADFGAPGTTLAPS